MKRTAVNSLLLNLLLTLLSSLVVAETQNRNEENKNGPEFNRNLRALSTSSATDSKSSAFPDHLDISTLQNMPLVILHPRTPIHFEMHPGQSLASIHKSLTPNKIFELLQSATVNSPVRALPPNGNPGDKRGARNVNSGNQNAQASVNRPVSVQSASNPSDPALPRSLMNPHYNNGWFQRFRGSFSTMFPVLKPAGESPFAFSLPTVNMPTFLPQPIAMHSTLNPVALNSHQHFQSMPWRNFNFQGPPMMHVGDLATGASYTSPLRVFGNRFMNRFRPSMFLPRPFGGDLATSGSGHFPSRLVPPPHFRIPPPVKPHKPLFSNADGLHAASMEISNAFADFTDAKEHGPEVTQKFGSVGHDINTFLKMMGLGNDLAFGNNVGGFGGAAEMASMDSTPIARSMDFYPGYGNQAHMDDLQNLDEMEDFPIFEKDITEEFMKNMNLTNVTLADEMIKEEVPEKEKLLPPKAVMESMDKKKVPVVKEIKDKEKHGKPSINIGENISYASAVPLEKTKEDSELKNKQIEQPKVNYKIPVIQSTVAPQDRKKPIAIYQNFKNKEDLVKPPAYAPAQEMPQQEEEENPNQLLDEDVVRKWQVINSGQGYVEKRPIPIVDILEGSKQPESLKVLQKVVSDTVKKDSS